MASTTFSGPVRSKNGNSNPTGLVAPTGAKTQLANAFADVLVKNTHYLAPADGAAITATLPTQANSTIGDVIIVDWHVFVDNGATQKFGTAGEFFEANSAVYKTTTVLAVVFAVDLADGTGDDFLNMVGLTNAGPGIATWVGGGLAPSSKRRNSWAGPM